MRGGRWSAQRHDDRAGLRIAGACHLVWLGHDVATTTLLFGVIVVVLNLGYQLPLVAVAARLTA